MISNDLIPEPWPGLLTVWRLEMLVGCSFG